MTYCKINNTDISSYVSGLKVGKETILSENSGRNASGLNVIDIVAEKYKVYLTLRPMTDTEMSSFLTLITNYVVSVSFLDPKTKALTTITAYHGTPEPEYYTIQNTKVLTKEMEINFIEM